MEEVQNTESSLRIRPNEQTEVASLEPQAIPPFTPDYFLDQMYQAAPGPETEELLGQNGESLSVWLADEVAANMKTLNMESDLANFNIVLTDGKNFSAETVVDQSDSSHYTIEIPREDLVDLLGNFRFLHFADKSAALSHEFFHCYVAKHYPKTHERNITANQNRKTDRAAYLRDRAEVGGELYASTHLQARKEVFEARAAQTQNRAERSFYSEMAKNYGSEVEKLSGEIKKRA